MTQFMTPRPDGRSRWGASAVPLLVFLLGLSGCASLSSVHQIQGRLQATDAHLRETEVRERALEHRLHLFRMRLGREIARLKLTEARLSKATQEAAAQSGVALRRVRLADEDWMASLPPRAGSKANVRSRRGSRWLFDSLVSRARRLALEPYAPLPKAPAALDHLGQAAYRAATYRGRLPFWPRSARLIPAFRPEGGGFDHPVSMHLVVGRRIFPLSFAPRDFRFPAPLARKLPAIIGAAGFSLVEHKTARPPFPFLSFLGASYFRARGLGQSWGSWARGLAIDTAVPNRREEFPAFRAFWIEVPTRSARLLTVFALLDGSGVTGAYRFRVTPGPSTQIRVTAVLFLRHAVRRLGLAPMVSMFLRGRMDPSRRGRLHPAVHDADGLSYETASGRWFWAPLADPHQLNVRSFSLDDPRGFGLLQSDRHFRSYQSLTNPYQRSPSLWIRPQGNWGSGHLELVEIPTRKSVDANIVAFWIPQNPPPPDHPLLLRYIQRWGQLPWPDSRPGRVEFLRETRPAHGLRTFTIYFKGRELGRIPAWVVLDGSVQAPEPVRDITLAKVTGTSRWRLRFTVPNRPGTLLRAWIRYRGRPLTETWTYQFPR